MRVRFKGVKIMVLEDLGKSLSIAIKKLMGKVVIDERAVNEFIRDLQRALLKADVKVDLVYQLSNNIRKRALGEEPPPGITKTEYLLHVTYQELTKLLGGEAGKLKVLKKKGDPFKILMVGVQGSGKTTSTAKLAFYLKKRGYKPGIICADTYRPGALEQLKQLVNGLGIPVYGEEKGNVIDIVKRGLESLRKEKVNVVLIDTAGRHKDEKALMKEVADIAKTLDPDEVMLTIDATIGQQAYEQAKAFKDAVPIGSIFLAKMDGSARGGGALSAVAATGAKILFIGTGEKLDDIEEFNPPRFVSRLLGLGDIEALVKKVREAGITARKEEVKRITAGKITLLDLLNQFKALRKMGPLSKVLSLIPGIGYSLPEELVGVTEEKIDRWIVIMQSMTREELLNPSIIDKSRIRRIAFGAGVKPEEVKELLRHFRLMKKSLKRYRKLLKRGTFQIPGLSL